MTITIPTNKKCQEIVANGIKKYHEGFSEELIKLRPCYNTFCDKVEDWINCTEKSEGCEHKCQRKINENVFWVYDDCICKGIKIYEQPGYKTAGRVIEATTETVAKHALDVTETKTILTTDQKFLTMSSTIPTDKKCQEIVANGIKKYHEGFAEELKTAGRVIEATTATIANNALDVSTQITETTTTLATDQKLLTESLTTTLLQNPDIPDSTDPEGLSDLVIICIIAAAVICFSILAGGLVYLVKVKMQSRNNSDQPESAARGNLPRFPREREENYIEMANPSFVGTEVVEGDRNHNNIYY